MNRLRALLDEHPLRAPQGTKDSRGAVLIVGGSPECPGGAVLAAEAALRSGAGRVQLAVHPAVAAHVAVAVPEGLVLPWDPEDDPPKELGERVEEADAVVVGPGYATDISAAAIAVATWVGAAPLVLDAGALGATRSLGPSARNLVVAPNSGEATEMVGVDGDEADLAVALAADLHRPLAVRGTTSVVTDGHGGLWLHEADASGLGTPGSGDVLMGILGAVLARGLDPLPALAWAIALHGSAGELLEREMEVGYLARDLVQRLPAALVEIGAGAA